VPDQAVRLKPPATVIRTAAERSSPEAAAGVGSPAGYGRELVDKGWPARCRETPAGGSNQRDGVVLVPTTAWAFGNTEGADAAVLRLKQLDTQDLIDVQDVTVIRWPEYAAQPQAQEHVTEEGSKVSSFVSKIRHTAIDSSMVESVKGDMGPGTSAVVLLSSDASIDAVVKAFEGQAMSLIRSDLSVQQEDLIRAAFSEGRH
jgi:uncharacterized membrane protein